MKKKLYEVAVLLNKHHIDGDRELLIPPTPVMAIDEEAAKYQAAFLAKDKDPASTPDDYMVLVRLFHQG